MIKIPCKLNKVSMQIIKDFLAKADKQLSL